MTFGPFQCENPPETPTLPLYNLSLLLVPFFTWDTNQGRVTKQTEKTKEEGVWDCLEEKGQAKCYHLMKTGEGEWKVTQLWHPPLRYTHPALNNAESNYDIATTAFEFANLWAMRNPM